MPLSATHPDWRQVLLIGFALAIIAGCSSGRIRDGAPSGSASIPDLPGDAIPRTEPRSRYGNGPVYEVFGKHYTVMGSSNGYSERGVASWYGKKFHGRLTSNRETYDMYEMTAAHKTLPLPTYVRVRNLRNDRSVVVRVNDRGPFVNNRIIDLSYAAALKLDMVDDGTSLVEVTAISLDEPAADRPVRLRRPPAPAAASAPTPVAATPEAADRPPARTPEPLLPHAENRVFAQVGAFGSRDNAERRHALLLSRGIANSFIHEDTSVEPPLYRVRVGPIVEVIQYDVLVEELQYLGISNPYLVTD